MTPEKVVQNKILKYLKQLYDEGKPLIFDRRQAGGFSYKMGIADVWACINGLHIEIEVKAPGGELRPMQEKWRDRCKQKNILWICCDDIEQFKAFIHTNFPEMFTQDTKCNSQ